MAWRTRATIYIRLRPEWQQALADNRITYFADEAHPTWMNPIYSRDMYAQFLKTDFEAFLKQVRLHGAIVDWKSHIVRQVECPKS